MEAEGLKVLLVATSPIAVAVLLGCAPLRRLARRVALAIVEWPWTRARRDAKTRPIELIARDARRLGVRFRQPPPGVSFARFEGTRWAYDKVLAEGCLALEIEHLLDVLPPGPELDAERIRVERRLYLAGFALDDAA